jgi:hypothetical protein
MVGANHRLMACGAEVDDGQAAMTQPYIGFNPMALSIWAAMDDGIGHLLQDDR